MYINIIWLIFLREIISDRNYTKNAILRLNPKQIISDRIYTKNAILRLEQKNLDNLIADIKKENSKKVIIDEEMAFLIFNEEKQIYKLSRKTLQDENKSHKYLQSKIDDLKIKIKFEQNYKLRKYSLIKQLAEIFSISENNFTYNYYKFMKPNQNLTKILENEIFFAYVDHGWLQNIITHIIEYRVKYPKRTYYHILNYYKKRMYPVTMYSIRKWIYYMPYFDSMIKSLRDFRLSKNNYTKEKFQNYRFQYIINLIYERITAKNIFETNIKTYDIIMYDCGIISNVESYKKCMAYKYLHEAINYNDLEFILGRKESID